MHNVVYQLNIGPYKQIGSTGNLQERLYHHKYLLDQNKHYNSFLQKVYNKHISFNYEIIASFSTRQEAYEEEQRILDLYFREPFYTMEHSKASGGSLKGENNPNTGKVKPKHSELIKDKWSEGVYSQRSTQQWKDKLSKARLGKSYPNLQAACKKPKPHLHKKIECITEGLIFNSLKEASQYYKLLPGNISQSIKLTKSVGERKIGKPLTFRYLS